MPATPATQVPELLTVAEAAAAVRSHRSTIYRRVQSGDLQAFRLGKGRSAPIRIPAPSLAALLAGRDDLVGTPSTATSGSRGSGADEGNGAPA